MTSANILISGTIGTSIYIFIFWSKCLRQKYKRVENDHAISIKQRIKEDKQTQTDNVSQKSTAVEIVLIKEEEGKEDKCLQTDFLAENEANLCMQSTNRTSSTEKDQVINDNSLGKQPHFNKPEDFTSHETPKEGENTLENSITAEKRGTDEYPSKETGQIHITSSEIFTHRGPYEVEQLLSVQHLITMLVIFRAVFTVLVLMYVIVSYT